MSEQAFGKNVWFFGDGDRPPTSDSETHEKESLVILYPDNGDARIALTRYDTDRPPVDMDIGSVCDKRVCCIRTYGLTGDEGHHIAFGQYAL